VRVTVSVGATMAVPTETPDDLVDRADAFMYASKRAGRNRGTTDTGELISNRPISSAPPSPGRPRQVDQEPPSVGPSSPPQTVLA
jgi:FOG: GGDEF domain